MNRRYFMRTLSLLSLAAAPLRFPEGIGNQPAPSFQKQITQRPPLDKRRFVSEAIEEVIVSTKNKITRPELATLFANCFPNTLDTTVFTGMRGNKRDTFVITGDIHAMWLRDSSAQVFPYLPYIVKDTKLKDLILGVIHRQNYCITIDPYANAFNYASEGSYWEKDFTTMRPELHERKWEIDSLCYPVRLSFNYYKISRDTSFMDDEWFEAMKLIYQTFREQQRITNLGPYRFQRNTTRQTDTLNLDGFGMPTKKIGLIHSMFRPSDDACQYPFLIPANYFAMISLREMAEMLNLYGKNSELSRKCGDFADELQDTLNIYGKAIHNELGELIPYEIDGFGNAYFTDDSNVPNIISLPYLNAMSIENDLYKKTRRFILSESNPFFNQGSNCAGVGSPHTPIGFVWHLSLIMQGLTSVDDTEIATVLKQLTSTHAETGFMHESFDPSNPENFTRPWFAWANTLFGEFVLKVAEQRPHLL